MNLFVLDRLSYVLNHQRNHLLECEASMGPEV